MTLTELDALAVRRSFDRAAPGYDQHAALQREVESRLLERVDYFGLQPQRVLDLGCGTGNGSTALQQRFPGAQVTALDVAPGMLCQALARATQPLPAVCADMHQLPFAPRCFDLVWSSLAIQWTTDQPGLFRQLRRVIRPGGLFLFSSFGPDTLVELRTAWTAADDKPHVNRFADMHDVGDQLLAAGFSEPVMDMETLTLTYPDVLSLMRELKAIGAHNSARQRAQGLTGKGRLARMLAAYEAFATDDAYPASYEVIYGVAFGPAEGQPLRTEAGEEAHFSVDALRRRTT